MLVVLIADLRFGTDATAAGMADACGRLRAAWGTASMAPSDGWTTTVLFGDVGAALDAALAVAREHPSAVFGVGWVAVVDAAGVPWGPDVARARRLAHLGAPGVRATVEAVAAWTVPAGVGVHAAPHRDTHLFGFDAHVVRDWR